ncbi:hypothetical protein J3E64_001705 [Sphingobium sp. OAS761]|uniref:hypothetical protein n=1 Tax=Sphingobium sp. OAS761 TaxID=2817901 RepID=UPI00209D50F8|nr:hypothetical protein [Sphingobium sp. OAS761]MCP1470018.1 hypothetical protein [Sphingobium sp. OAS761]
MNAGIFFPIMGMAIPIVAILSRVAVRWIRMKERQIEAQTSLGAEKAAQYAAGIERMEQRIRVLERIATDRGHDLADEIDSLRDAPLN